MPTKTSRWKPLGTCAVWRHDVLTTHEVGKSDGRIPDEEVLDFAIEQNRAVLTINRKDFKRPHRQNPIHAGIVICTKNDDFENFADCIHAVLQGFAVGLSNELIRVYRPR